MGRGNARVMHDCKHELRRARGSGQAAVRRARHAPAAGLLLALAAVACTETFNAGSTSHGKLPVDQRNPMILVNDSNAENWQGEYAALLANNGGPKLVAIIVNTGSNATDIEQNNSDWQAMVTAARNGGLGDIPDPEMSSEPPLNRPDNGSIDQTTFNSSHGAQVIRDQSRDHSLPYRPLVVVTGGRLTDVAVAYLIDHTVPDRVVVVSSLGRSSASGGGTMSVPNGEMDPWADVIVTSKFRYVQVSAFYDQTTDVTSSLLSDVPVNDFTNWISNKQPGIWNVPAAADQVAVAAVGIPDFVKTVVRVSAGQIAAGATTGPDLTLNPTGPLWLVTEISASTATNRFQQLLLDPATFSH